MTSFRLLTNTLSSTFGSTSSPQTRFLLTPSPQFKARVRVPGTFSPEVEKSRLKARAGFSGSFGPDVAKNRVVEKIQSSSKALIITIAAALMIGRFSQFTARAETPVTAVVQEKEKGEKCVEERVENEQNEKSTFSKLLEFSQSHSEAIDALAGKSDDSGDEKVLKTLKLLISTQPSDPEWKFCLAALYNERGEKGEARKVYLEILDKEPSCFDALFLNTVLMDQSGETQAAIQMLEERLNLAQDKQARNVRLILAQIQYLQKNVDGALKSYEELVEEDPTDYRPYFYQHVIYSLLDRNDEAKAQLAKIDQLCPKDFKVWMIQ